MASAIPSHLKPSANGNANANVANGEANEFARKHHGKTQSHVVSARIPPPYTAGTSLARIPAAGRRRSSTTTVTLPENDEANFTNLRPDTLGSEAS